MVENPFDDEKSVCFAANPSGRFYTSSNVVTVNELSSRSYIKPRSSLWSGLLEILISTLTFDESCTSPLIRHKIKVSKDIFIYIYIYIYILFAHCIHPHRLVLIHCQQQFPVSTFGSVSAVDQLETANKGSTLTPGIRLSSKPPLCC